MSQELERGEIQAQWDRNPEEQDKQVWLTKLAERTVLQAEKLGQEIVDRARQESEVEGSRIREQYTAEAKEQMRRIIESAEQQCVVLTNEAAAKAQVSTEGILARAQTQGREIVDNAQDERQEILGRAQREALAIVSAAKTRAESYESDGKLRAESIIRQMRQSVADEIHHAVVESRRSIPAGLVQLGQHVPEEPSSGQNGSYAILLEETLDMAVSNGAHDDPPTTDELPAETQPLAQLSTGRKYRSSNATKK